MPEAGTPKPAGVVYPLGQGLPLARVVSVVNCIGRICLAYVASCFEELVKLGFAAALARELHNAAGPSETQRRLFNLNVGVLGHVDSGKTSLGKVETLALLRPGGLALSLALPLSRLLQSCYQQS